MSPPAINVANFVTLRLKSDNYPLWREQVLGLAESQDLLSYLTGAAIMPSPVIAATDGSSTATPKVNPEYSTWKKNDVLLRSWINATLSEEALALVIGLESSAHTWLALKEDYVQASQERVFHLQQDLNHMRKDDSTSLHDYLRRYKSVCDSLATIGKPVDNRTKVFSLLNGFGDRYDTFVTTMLKPPHAFIQRDPPPSSRL